MDSDPVYDWDPIGGCFQQKEKRDTMARNTDADEVKNYSVNTYGGYHFATLDEAIAYAQKRAMKDQEDVKIWLATNIVKYPVPDYPVEAIVAETPSA